MKKEYDSFRCPHCGRALIASEIPDYVYQCLDCDEDFYSIEAVKFTTVFSAPTDEDQHSMNECGLNVDLSDRIKISVSDNRGHSGYCYMKKADVKRLGMEYIKDHTHLNYSVFLEEYSVTVPENDYYNDLSRNPEKVIPVSFAGIEDGTGREIYKNLETGCFYLREVSRTEPFAKWFSCGKRLKTDGGNELRPNLIFQFKDQTEKVTYDDWNGVCAYRYTFNQNFRQAG